jgi:hypothetical protein
MGNHPIFGISRGQPVYLFFFAMTAIKYKKTLDWSTSLPHNPTLFTPKTDENVCLLAILFGGFHCRLSVVPALRHSEKCRSGG